MQESSDDLASHQPMSPPPEWLRAVLIGDERLLLALGFEPKQERASPSTVISIGTLLLVAVGVVLGLLALKPPPPTLCNSITFENDGCATWPEGSAPPGRDPWGHTAFTDDRQIYQVVATKKNSTVDAPAHSYVMLEEGLCLTVNARVERGRPDVYGVIFHLVQEDSLRLSIDEWAEMIRLDKVMGASVQALTEQPIGQALHGTKPEEWHSICMAIRSKRVDVWLNGCAVLSYEGENLSAGGIGVFAVSGAEKDRLPLEVNFRDFAAVPLSLECPP